LNNQTDIKKKNPLNAKKKEESLQHRERCENHGNGYEKPVVLHISINDYP